MEKLHTLTDSFEREWNFMIVDIKNELERRYRDIKYR